MKMCTLRTKRLKFQIISPNLRTIIFALLVVLGLCSACVAPVTPTETIPPTSPKSAGKASIEGIVIGGGDKSPSGLMGGPRTFIYEVRTDSREIILVTYVA